VGPEGQQVQLDQKHGKNGSLRRTVRPEGSGRKERAASTMQQMVSYSVNYDAYAKMAALSLEESVLVLPKTGMLNSATSASQLALLPCSGAPDVRMEKIFCTI